MLTLIADNLPRFMTCNGSRLMPQHAPFNVDDSLREEGNAAHWFIEQVHKGKYLASQLIDRKAPNNVFITGDMVDHTAPFLAAIMGKGDVECETSHGDQRYQINGRADHIFYDRECAALYVNDFKYGWGIVEPEKNWTLISHAIGWYYRNKLPINSVIFNIYQPRPHHPAGKVRQWVINGNEFVQLSLELTAAVTKPNDMLNTSKHCKDCAALATCPAAQKADMNAIDVSEMAYVADLDDVSLGYILDQIERASKMLETSKKAYSELALHRLKAGSIIPGYGTEKELTNKQWKDGITPETIPVLTGMDLTKKQLITPAQAIKAGLSEEIANTLCERREKGIKLAKIDANTKVKKMFGNLT